MKKIALSFLLNWIPFLAYAANNESSSISFTPPPGDYSVIFLGNIFGIVDGVLHGTGSQIMATMFGVFNSAAMALGAMTIMYTTIVSTMNTAHEGQMLGQKWSSIWVPMRSALGLALLVPKASGYCLMQVLVMWIIVQGIGAADKVWEAALSYLNKGGVIIQAQTSAPYIVNYSAKNGIADGAAKILVGEVCMLGLEKQLINQQKDYLRLKDKKSGPCYGNPTGTMKTFCNASIPDFLGSVNAVSYQNDNASAIRASSFVLTMPNFDPTSDFASLNGVCGNISWFNPVGSQNEDKIKEVETLSANDINTIRLSRAIAIQQMYIDLGIIAQKMVNNDPQINQELKEKSGENNTFKLQFGMPYTKDNNPCAQNNEKDCVNWGAVPGDNNDQLLLNGTEFQGALQDYNGIMMPTVNLFRQMQDKDNANKSRQFIHQADNQGWIMAGSYFFNVINLNGNAVENADNLQNLQSGLETSTYVDLQKLIGIYSGESCKDGKYQALCTWFGQNSYKASFVANLINGWMMGSQVAPPSLNQSINTQLTLQANKLASTAFGYINNAMILKLPNQPGLNTLSFDNKIIVKADPNVYRLQPQNFECGRVKIMFFSFCLGEMLGNLFYNVIIMNIYNVLITFFQQFVNQIVMALIMIPLQGMSTIFQQGMDLISAPGVNPITALASMGTYYINFAGDLWLMAVTLAASNLILGPFILGLIALIMPLVAAWITMMVTIGFITAYYIPLLPYIIFTFGAIGWMMSVIEAMVSAPIVALGISHPEGHDAFGKGDPAILILMNVFLRPAMMIIGYIAAIALSYVGVWFLNAGFDNAILYIQGGNGANSAISYSDFWKNTGIGQGVNDAINTFKNQGISANSAKDAAANYNSGFWNNVSGHFQKNSFNIDNSLSQQGSGAGGYLGWAGIFAFFFAILAYTTMYLVIVQKAFTLITALPDKVLRWIGGQAETVGSETGQWGQEAQQKFDKGQDVSNRGLGQADQQLTGHANKAVSGIGSKLGQTFGGASSASIEKSAPESTPDKNE